MRITDPDFVDPGLLQFRKLESAIKRCVDRYPQHTELYPDKGVSADWLRIQLIAATKWLDEHSYHDVNFSREIYNRMRLQFSIGLTADKRLVYWGPKRYKRKKDSLTQINDTDNSPRYSITEPVDVANQKTLSSLVYLKSIGVINGPVKVINLTSEMAEKIELESDVSVINDDDTTILL